MTDEVGRELKVSELKPGTIVVVHKEGRPMMTLWVVEVLPRFVHFRAGAVGVEILAMRLWPGDEITDDSGIPTKIYEYLGKP